MSLSKEKIDINSDPNSDEVKAVSEGAVMIKDPRKRRKCPLCHQNMYLYNFDLEEMILMCENIGDCVYPFGYELLQIVRDESELIDKPEKCTPWLFEYPRAHRPPIFQDLQILNALYYIEGLRSARPRSGDNLSRLRRELRKRRQEEEEQKYKRLKKLTKQFMVKLIELDKKTDLLLKKKKSVTVESEAGLLVKKGKKKSVKVEAEASLLIKKEKKESVKMEREAGQLIKEEKKEPVKIEPEAGLLIKKGKKKSVKVEPEAVIKKEKVESVKVEP